MVDTYTQTAMKSTNVTRFSTFVSQGERSRRHGHLGGVLWFTGLPASGKKTIGHQLEKRLFDLGYEVFAFNSSWLRKGLTSDLGFRREDRKENIRRAGELAALMATSGLVVITSFISPYAEDRAGVRSMANNFHEIYLKVPVEICELRDSHNRYVRARSGELEDFTGISAPYEKPVNPEVILDGKVLSKEDCLEYLVDYVDRNFRNF